jgi:hypothetical protein
MMLPAARSNVSPLIVFAAAVGAGFVATGLGAIWLVKNRVPVPAETIVAAPTHQVDSAPPPEPPSLAAVTHSAIPVAIAEPMVKTPKEPESVPAAPPKSTAAMVKQPEKKEGTRLVDSLPELPFDSPDPAKSAVRPGFLTVRCSPACDKFVVGGQTSSSLARSSFAPGQYRVQCIRDDVRKIISVIVVSDQHSMHQIKMD